MFARIFSVFMAVILLVTGVVAGLCAYTLRDDRISARLQDLTSQAREIAWLAAQTDTSLRYWYSQDASMEYLSRKAEEVYAQYGAYILVVDRSGHVLDNMQAAYQEDPAFVESLSTSEVNEALIRVLNGQEVSVRTMLGSMPCFTVGVPFVQNDAVRGAVLIRTPAQRIEDGLDRLIAKIALVALAAILVAAVAVFFIVRSLMKPLRQLTDAADTMADGDFSMRVEPGGTPEVRRLAVSFNTMAEKLSQTEAGRREFVANVSHELRSPITSIRGFVESMEDGTIPPEEHPRYLALVSKETKRLSKLIGDLLALSRLERDDAALNITVFDLCELLRRAVVNRMNDLESRQIEIVCDFDSDSVFAEGDSDRIDQVAVNLLDNAIRFTPEGGQITLSVHASGNTVEATVADNGQGILPEDRPHVFERFYTADKAHTSGKGTGLGLSICQRIMQMHGQSIRLNDTENGASFTFTLKKSANSCHPAEE